MKKLPKFSDDDIARIIEMAWEDRTPFDAIKSQFKFNEDIYKIILQFDFLVSHENDRSFKK